MLGKVPVVPEIVTEVPVVPIASKVRILDSEIGQDTMCALDNEHVGGGVLLMMQL